MQAKQIPQDYVLVLQQLEEDGEDDFDNLAESLRLDRKRLAHVIESLYHKGLISFSYHTGREAWISLSTKGHRLLKFLWPETGLQPSY